MVAKNGKGDRPRNCYSKHFKSNYDRIQWDTGNTHKKKKKKKKKKDEN